SGYGKEHYRIPERCALRPGAFLRRWGFQPRLRIRLLYPQRRLQCIHGPAAGNLSGYRSAIGAGRDRVRVSDAVAVRSARAPASSIAGCRRHGSFGRNDGCSGGAVREEAAISKLKSDVKPGEKPLKKYTPIFT